MSYDIFPPKNPQIESLEYPGYYEIPNFSRFLVNKDGHVIKKFKSGESVNCFLDHKGYRRFNVKSDNGISNSGQHRLVALAFLHPGIEVKGLVVNHKNGIKLDNRIENLEWTTDFGNKVHAAENGLITIFMPVKLEIRNALTGEVIRFTNIDACANSLEMPKDGVRLRLAKGEKFFDENFIQFRLGHSDSPWYVPTEQELEYARIRGWKPIFIRSLITGEEWKFEKRTEAAKFLGVCDAVICNWANKPNQPVIPGFYQLRISGSSPHWRHVEDPILELSMNTSNRAVRVYNPETGDEMIFPTAVGCSKKMCVRTTTLDWRIKSDGKKVYSDGYTYQHYENYIKENPCHAGQQWPVDKLFI